MVPGLTILMVQNHLIFQNLFNSFKLFIGAMHIAGKSLKQPLQVSQSKAKIVFCS